MFCPLQLCYDKLARVFIFATALNLDLNLTPPHNATALQMSLHIDKFHHQYQYCHNRHAYEMGDKHEL